MTTTEVRDLRAAFEWEAARARVDYPQHLLMAVFDRACVTAATRRGRQAGPENPRRDPTVAIKEPRSE
jgi:hypothetical protein